MSPRSGSNRKTRVCAFFADTLRSGVPRNISSGTVTSSNASSVESNSGILVEEGARCEDTDESSSESTALSSSRACPETGSDMPQLFIPWFDEWIVKARSLRSKFDKESE